MRFLLPENAWLAGQKSLQLALHLTGFSFSNFDLDLSKITFEFVKNGLEGLTFLSPAECDLCRPKSTHDKNPAPLNPAAQVKEQACRAGDALGVNPGVSQESVMAIVNVNLISRFEVST